MLAESDGAAPKWSLLNSKQKKKNEARKEKKRGEEKAKRKIKEKLTKKHHTDVYRKALTVCIFHYTPPLARSKHSVHPHLHESDKKTSNFHVFFIPLLSNLSLNIHFRKQKNSKKIHLYFSIRQNAPWSLPEVQKGENNSCVHGPALACTQTFYFSFVHHERRAWENERGARERKNLFCSSSTTTPLYWRSIHPPRFTFYRARSTDFEEKKDGLWTG